MKRQIIFFIFSCLLNTIGFSQADSIEMAHDTVNYLCSFDNMIIDGIRTSKIYKPLDKDFPKLISNIEIDVRSANYMKIFEAGFISTAGATWRRNQQVFLYNPERLKKLRLTFSGKDTLQLLLKGIVLHELGHHLMPHAFIRLLRNNSLAVDSVKIFERQADNFMGQMLRRIYKVKEEQAKLVIEKLVIEKDPIQQSFTKKERMDNVMAGWEMGGHPLAFSSPLYNSFLKIQHMNTKMAPPRMASPPEMHEVSNLKFFKRYSDLSDTVDVVSSEYSAKFKIEGEKGFAYLLLKKQTDKKYERVAAIVESDIPLFPLIAYDQYFVTWYISKDDKVFSMLNGDYIYLGNLDDSIKAFKDSIK